jgi:SpoVK/Ycf46/Vps4 family AAA+-type ATPase
MDSDKAARRRSIEATRQVPNARGLDTVAGLAETKKLLHEAVLLPLKFPHLFTGSSTSQNTVEAIARQNIHV